MVGVDSITNLFYSPLQKVLIKGEEQNGQWVIYLQASNELLDQDGETVEMSALKKAADYFMSHGVLSWDHKHKITHDPGFIIGEPLDVKFSRDNETLVKGFLYKENDIAQKVWKNIHSGATKLGASIGGGILQKSENAIKSVIWDETAITHKPVNDGTLGSVRVLPFSEFAKALMAGSGVDASTFTGGRALIPESLQGAPSNSITSKDVTELFNMLLIGVRNGQITSYAGMLDFVRNWGYDGETAAVITNYIARKFPDVIRNGR